MQMAKALGMLAVGGLLGILAFPLLPSFAQDWLGERQTEIASVRDGVPMPDISLPERATPTPNARQQLVETLMPSRPSWCPRNATWIVEKVPSYSGEYAPACKIHGQTGYAGYWPGIRGCSTVRSSALRFDGEGLVMVNGQISTNVRTACP